MKKVFLFSLFLVLGLVLSQCLPVWLGEAFLTAEKVAKTLMFVCLAFIMINVGREFELDKTKWRSYAADYFIAMALLPCPGLWSLFIICSYCLPICSGIGMPGKRIYY